MPRRSQGRSRGEEKGHRKKLIELAVWLSGKDRKPCDECWTIWESYNGTPPCDTCRPNVHRDNIDVAEIYSLVSDQWIIAYSGPVGIRMASVEVALRMSEIPKTEWLEIVMKIKTISSVIIKQTEGEN